MTYGLWLWKAHSLAPHSFAIIKKHSSPTDPGEIVVRGAI